METYENNFLVYVSIFWEEKPNYKIQGFVLYENFKEFEDIKNYKKLIINFLQLNNYSYKNDWKIKYWM